MKVKEYVNLDNKDLTYYINERTNKVMCYRHTKADEIVSAFSVETFKSIIKRGRFVEIETVEPYQPPFYKRGDFWANVTTITVLLILCVGFMFV